MTTLIAPSPLRAPAARPSRSARRWPAIVALGTGATVLAATLLWIAYAVPALVKFPTDLDQNPRYTGTFTLFVDPATAAPLTEPTVAALSVDRRVEGVPSESGAERVVVRETIRHQIDGIAPATQVHQYVMDRRTNANVDDPRAWAFEATNLIDRAGAYWVAMPADLGAERAVTMFKDEIGGVFTAHAGTAQREVDGLDLVEFSAAGQTEPLTEAYLHSLDEVVPLPRTLTFDQLKPSLVAAGVPVDEALAALVATADPQDLATLVALIEEPIALEYVDSFTGQTFVEPRTGAIVDVTSVVERISARPSSAQLPQLLAVLERYRAQPPVAEALTALAALETEPLPVFEYRYAQDTQSVEEIAVWVGEQRERIDLAERLVPLALGAIGTLLLLSGGVLIVRRRVGGAP